MELNLEQQWSEMVQVVRFIGSKVRRFFTAIPLLACVTSIRNLRTLRSLRNLPDLSSDEPI